MGDMFCVKVVYHQRPEKMMRALNFFSSRPKIMGQPLHANTVLLLPEENIRENRQELEGLLMAGVISITGTDGKAFEFEQSTMYSIPAEMMAVDDLPSLDALLSGALQAEEMIDAPKQAPPPELIASDPDPEGLLPADALADLKVPGEIVEAEPAALEAPPELQESDVPISSNDQFFSDLKQHVVSSRRTRTKKTKVPE